MDPKLFAALNALAREDFDLMFGRNDVAERMYTRWLKAKEQDALLNYVLELTQDQRMELSLLLRLKIEQETVEVKGTYWQLHRLITWSYSEGHSFFIKVKEEPAGFGEADFSVLVSNKTYQLYQQIRRVKDVAA